MDHSEVSLLLLDLDAESLVSAADWAPGQARAVAEHVRVCPECRDLFATSRLLASALGQGAGPAREDSHGGGHVETELLVRHALQPEGLSPEARERCGAHLKVCADCRQDLELTRAAVLAAREGEPENELAKPRLLAFAARWPATRVAQVALAAGLVIAAGTALFVGIQTPKQQVLSEAAVHGVETMTARDSILVDHTTLHSGARVVLEGGDLVAFGEGFSVGEGASLTVSTLAHDNDEASG